MNAIGQLPRRTTTLVDAEETHHKRHALFKRPRIAEPPSEGTSFQLSNSLPTHHVTSNESAVSTASQSVPIYNPIVEKRRFELFIDLIWVGIIGQLSETFSEQAYSPESDTSIGQALGNFIITFLIAWRLWKFLQEFMSKFATNDMIESWFTLWILILAMLYGNNAAYLFAQDESQDNIALTIYLIARVSFLAIEAVYAIFIPSLRRPLLARAGAAGPVIAIWIGSFWVGYPGKAVMLFFAVVAEFSMQALLTTPYFDHFFREERARQTDQDHWVERIRDFFIIILGENVLNLIRGNPLGRGLSEHCGTGIIALCIYYSLSGLYFNRDHARRFIHPVKRQWWRAEAWLLTHVVMFHATLILGVSILFIIANPYVNALPEEGNHHEVTEKVTPESRPETTEEQELRDFMFSAKWSVGSSLAVVVLSQIILALLARNLDKPGTMKVDNRYIRLLPRFLTCIVAVALPAARKMAGSYMLSILLGCLVATLWWEWICSMDKGGSIFEKTPK